tara:strand:- start:1818 stop:4853 length:3036 start_codon:yes stop_codon:yes gene_type:complete
MKIIISETQYKKVFDNDFLIVSEQVDGISGVAISAAPKLNMGYQPVKPNQFKLNSVPPNLSLNLTEKLLKFGPKGEEIPEIPLPEPAKCAPMGMEFYPTPEGWDWCNSYQKSDSYMGNTVTTYYSNNKKIVVNDSIPVFDFKKIYSDYTVRDSSTYGWLNDAIRSWNDVNGKWGGMQRDANWIKNIYNLSVENIQKLGGDKLLELFSGCNDREDGVCNTDLLYPGVLIEEYIERNIDTQKDFFVQLQREIFKKEQAKKVEEYNKILEKFIEEEKEWDKMYGKAYADLVNAQKEFNTKYQNPNDIHRRNFADNTRVDNSYLNFDPIIKTTDTKKEEKKYIEGVGDALGLDLSDLPLKITSNDLKKKFVDYLRKYYPEFPNLIKGKPNDISDIKWLETNNTLQRLWGKFRVYYAYFKLEKVPPPPVAPDPVSARSFSSREGDELSQKEQQLETLKSIITSITKYNQKFIDQYKYSKYYNSNDKGGCKRTRGYKLVRYNEPCKSAFHRVWEGTGSDRYSFCQENVELSNWKSYCSNDRNGGVWWYKSSKSTGGCGCVTNSMNQFLDQYGQTYTEIDYLTKNIKTDVRTIGEKWDDCIGDWHCVADIASIAALVVFAPLNTVVPGISYAISAGIDAISAGGYIVEGDPGWQINAGLTLLGGLFSGADAFKLAKAGSKAGKLTKWSKALTDTVEDMGKLESKLKKMSKVEADNFWVSQLRTNLGDLSATELKYIDDLLNSVKNIKGDLKDKFSKILEALKPLSKGQKAELSFLLKNPKTTKNFIKLVEKNGWDLAKTLEKYQFVRLGREGLIQASLFGLLTNFSEEIGEKILSSIDMLKELTGINLRPMLGVPDKDPKDGDSEKVKKILKDFKDYRFFAKSIDITLRSSSWREMQEKYDLKVEKDLYDEIFNSEDPIVDTTALTNILAKLDLMYEISKEMEKQNKSKEEIKNKLQQLLDEALKIAVETTGFRDNLNTLEDIRKRTGYSEEDIEIFKQNNMDLEFNDTQEQMMNILY